MTAPPLQLVVVGHVDHGKSTLIGRLLHEAGMLPTGNMAELEAQSQRRGVAAEGSFVQDAFQAERDQAVTIDTARLCLRLPGRDIVIIDAPGHREFLANMASGAAGADAALLVVDALEGMQEQSQRHAHLLRLLGLQQVVVVVNKLDLIGFSEPRFREIERDAREFLAGIGITPSHILPISAQHGDNLVQHSAKLPWHGGPTVLQAIESLSAHIPAEAAPLRLPLQDVHRQDDKRVLIGHIESGRLAVGDRLLFSPSNKTAHVRSIEAWPASPNSATTGQSLGITLDRPLFVERGEIASHEGDAPVLTNVFRATLFWLGSEPLTQGRTYRLQLATAEAPVTVETILRVIDTDTLAASAADTVQRDQVAEVILRSPALLAVDEHARLPRTGRFVLRSNGETIAGGLASVRDFPNQRPAVTVKSANVTPVAHKVTRASRAEGFGHRSGVLWFTGLSGAGKSTLAMAVEQHLFRKGYAVYVLDGDNVRSGLSANLGFAPEDRVENIRRVGEVAALFADAGFLCITAFISPYRTDRERAREAAKDSFHEIYIDADLATCEQRDPKGLYRRARAGEIADFTGITAPYEPPENPELIVDTGTEPTEACVERILRYVEQVFALTPKKG
jgi:bifunctional enzyme CysN/CysC